MIESVKINEASHPLLNEVKRTYTDSFPPCERRKFEEVKKLVEENPQLTIEAFLFDNQYTGFITSWHLEDFIYIEHFAIEEKMRNRQIGRQVLTHFISEKKKPVVLEVEIPEDEMSRRRIGFYERIGFTLDTHISPHPPYQEGEAGIELHVMAYGEPDLSNKYEKIKKELYKHVY